LIPFVRDMDFAYGEPQQVSPLIRRVVANNPGPFTFHGTGTYIVGHGEVAVIDPGPADAAHLQALLKAVEGERVTAIVLTHDHNDHAPLAAEFARATGGEIVGAKPRPKKVVERPGVEEGQDRTYRPDRILVDGDVISSPGWTLRTLATPGHTGNHLCYVLEEENALFSGDHVMGWSTTVIVPPDGDMGRYYDSMRKVMAGGFSTLWPTHGPPVTDVEPFLEAYLGRRMEREAQILAMLKRGPQRIPDFVSRLYIGIDPRLKMAAGASMLAHLIHLVKEGRVVTDGAPDFENEYRLAE
jgi:glyoxylase-like metal-dependent hydrolase (beta-lactamase superfamily II)